MSKTRKKLLLYTFVTDFLILAFTIAFSILFKPLELINSNKKSTCVFQKLFGMYCPGCSGTRSLGYLLSFDIINSFIYYPPIIIGVLLIIFINILLIYSFKKDSFSPIKKHKYFEFLLIPISIFLTFLIRNILLYYGIDYIGDFYKTF